MEVTLAVTIDSDNDGDIGDILGQKCCPTLMCEHIGPTQPSSTPSATAVSDTFKEDRLSYLLLTTHLATNVDTHMCTYVCTYTHCIMLPSNAPPLHSPG